jgi:hypothetical protein
MGYQNVGLVWDRDSFYKWAKTQNVSWAKGVTMHHTASPSLAQRPHGLKIEHMHNLQHYYQQELGWSAGPHLFIDEDQIWGMSSIESPGTHAKSFNATHIGIEVLGNYDGAESPITGRGLECWTTAAHAVRALLDVMGLDASDINGHRDDPKTSKTCPGSTVDLDWFRGMVNALSPHDSDREDDIDTGIIADALDAIDWQTQKLRDMLL